MNLHPCGNETANKVFNWRSLIDDDEDDDDEDDDDDVDDVEAETTRVRMMIKVLRL